MWSGCFDLSDSSYLNHFNLLCVLFSEMTPNGLGILHLWLHANSFTGLFFGYISKGSLCLTSNDDLFIPVSLRRDI